MAPHLQRVFKALIITSIIFIVHSDGDDPIDPIPVFPKLSEFDLDFYQTEVIVTNEDQNIAAFATEYYDETGSRRGRVDVLAAGNRKSVFWNNETNEILEVNSTTCQVWDIDESIYDYQGLFYGWLNKDPLIIGPTAPLWYAEAHRSEIVALGSAMVRDIMCDKYSLDYKTDSDNVTFYYYFSMNDWTTPYKLEDMRTPVRIEVRGESSRDTAAADQVMPINLLTDFTFFRPDIKDFRVFQPPEGIGCPLRKGTRSMPPIPKVFRFSAEVVDLLKSDDTEISDIETHRIWYDYNAKLARFDKYTRQRYVSEIYDFNTGVTYSNVDGRTCTIKALRNSMFESYRGMMMGELKEPAEVLHLDGEFYYMGKKIIRGIWSDVFESVDVSTTLYNDILLLKTVVTVYYSEEFMAVNIGGESESRIPLFLTIKGYDSVDHVAVNVQYNIFSFNDVIYPDMYSTFGMGRCFPSMEDKSYFLMLMNLEVELIKKMEEQDDFVIEELRGQIVKNAKVSNLRLPYLKADYKTTGVFITGLMLDRPPALKQFWLEYEGDDASTIDNDLRVAPAADTKEKCAFACIDEDSFSCTGFFFCGQVCFLKSKDVLEPSKEGDKKYVLGVCQEWLRAERDSSNKETYLAAALKNLEDAVLNLTIKIDIRIDDDTTAEAPVSDIVIGDGPYTGKGNQEKPYTMVINFAKLTPTDETTEALTYIDNLNDCYKACKQSEDLSCSSFSYCPDSDNKQCLISSVMVIDRRNNMDDTVDDKNCYVYALKYLDFYLEYPGRVALIPGADAREDVKSAEECAMHCRRAQTIVCRGFEYCRTSKMCVLHSKHVLDMQPGEVTTKKNTLCTHYAVKYAADYYDMGFTLVDDKSDVRSELSLEDCAKICSEELKGNCNSFNYCPASGPYMTDSSCALTSLTLSTKDVPTAKTPPCHHYEKKEKVDDWVKPKGQKKPTQDNSGYTSSGFNGLVVGMLFLGLALGAIGFVLYSYFKSRSSGEGMSVRFMKQDNI